MCDRDFWQFIKIILCVYILIDGSEIFNNIAPGTSFVSRYHGGAKCTSSPWYIMTSPMNHDETESFFQEKGFLGLEASQVKFFPQGTPPCMTPEGKMMLETGCKVGAASDGNGGIYGALRSKGCMADMESRGIKYIHTHAVDNTNVMDILSMRNRYHR